jgi:Domain of unknown function (DUF5618)
MVIVSVMFIPEPVQTYGKMGKCDKEKFCLRLGWKCFYVYIYSTVFGKNCGKNYPGLPLSFQAHHQNDRLGEYQKIYPAHTLNSYWQTTMNDTLTELIKPKQELLREAKRYLANGKETIAKSPIEGKLYADEKYVREGAGIAYLAALKAIDGYLVGKGISNDSLPKSIEDYWSAQKKHIPINGKFRQNFTLVYKNLHIGAYYQGINSVAFVKEGLQAVKEIISMLED